MSSAEHEWGTEPEFVGPRHAVRERLLLDLFLSAGPGPSVLNAGAGQGSFSLRLARLGFDTGRSETPITPVMMGDPDTAGRFSQRLFEEGVFAQPVVFPTVAIDKARIRTIVTS